MKKAISILSALLTLWISINLGVATHFCKGERAQTKLVYGTGNADCGMQCSTYPQDNTPHNTTISHSSCCADDFTIISTEQYHSSNNSIKLLVNTFVLFAEFKLFAKNLAPVTTNKYKNNPPPLITEVTLSFIQVFLI